jgi:thioredoxin 1
MTRSKRMVTTTSDAMFDADVLGSDVPVLMEFGAAWCPPCRMLAPVLDDIAGERAGDLRVVTMDVDANPLTQARYRVMSVPTLLLFVRGTPIRQVIGFTSKGRLLQVLDEALAAAA